MGDPRRRWWNFWAVQAAICYAGYNAFEFGNDEPSFMAGVPQLSFPGVTLGAPSNQPNHFFQRQYQVHYDLSWNPTRHEQREGRVDRFRQPRPRVRVLTYYGTDNGIDGIVLEVLLRSTGGVHLRAGIGELARDPPANPSTGAGDDRHLAVQRLHPGTVRRWRWACIGKMELTDASASSP